MSILRVVVADDDEAMRSALVDTICNDERFEVVATAATGPEAVDHAERWQPHLVLLDVRMPGGGPGAVRDLRRASPRTAVVAISADQRLRTVASMLRAGVVGYLAKGVPGPALTEVLRSCADGGFHVAIPRGASAVLALRHPMNIEEVTAPDAGSRAR